MNHPSPYTLLRDANGLRIPVLADPNEPAWTDLHTLAAHWQDLHQEGPPMRTPAPMHPPIAYPTATQIYDASAPSSKTRHANYDAIIEQHKTAAEKAVYVPAALE